MSFEEIGRPVIAPHRGFSPKAREILLDPPHNGGMSMPPKSNSDFDLRRKLMTSCSLRRKESQSQGGSMNSSPKSRSSTQSIEKTADGFDAIGDIPRVAAKPVQKHKYLGELGKTRSAGDVFRANGHMVDKQLFRTYQQDNIMRLPSVDSDLESSGAYRSITGDDAVSPYPGEQPDRAQRYEVNQKVKSVKSWLEKQ